MNPTKLERQVNEAAALLKAASNPQRLLILCHLTEGEKSVGDLEKLLEMRQPHLSQQLARLRQDDLVETRRDSRTIYYSLGSEEARRLIALLYDIYCSKDNPIQPRKKRARTSKSSLAKRRNVGDPINQEITNV